MRNGTQSTFVTMVSPKAGFAARVMARITEHERAQALRRALVGSVLLFTAAGTVVSLVGFWLASWAVTLATTPEVITSALTAYVPFVFWTSAVLEALWVAAAVVARHLNAMQLAGYALAVFALTLVWVHAVSGSSQFSPQNIQVGGSK